MVDHVRHNRVRLPANTEVHFLTFANTSYMEPTRILEEAKEFGFATIQAMSENDIPEFVWRHHTFIAENPQGYGLWIWKPKIILDRMARMEEGDIVVYCDAGMHLNNGGLLRYYEYLNMMNIWDMLTFSLNDAYKAQHYVKRDAIDTYYPEFAIDDIDPYCYGGVMMIKKSAKSLQLLEDWLKLCEVYHFIDRSESMSSEFPHYKGNDCDNGLFNLCLVKHRVSHAIYPDETNVYTTDGYQYHQATADDWKRLDMFPFQCRRLRPAR
jgi:hypothetical protein